MVHRCMRRVGRHIRLGRTGWLLGRSWRMPMEIGNAAGVPVPNAPSRDRQIRREVPQQLSGLREALPGLREDVIRFSTALSADDQPVVCLLQDVRAARVSTGWRRHPAVLP